MYWQMSSGRRMRKRRYSTVEFIEYIINCTVVQYSCTVQIKFIMILISTILKPLINVEHETQGFKLAYSLFKNKK